MEMKIFFYWAIILLRFLSTYLFYIIYDFDRSYDRLACCEVE